MSDPRFHIAPPTTEGGEEEIHCRGIFDQWETGTSGKILPPSFSHHTRSWDTVVSVSSTISQDWAVGENSTVRPRAGSPPTKPPPPVALLPVTLSPCEVMHTACCFRLFFFWGTEAKTDLTAVVSLSHPRGPSSGARGW